MIRDGRPAGHGNDDELTAGDVLDSVECAARACRGEWGFVSRGDTTVVVRGPGGRKWAVEVKVREVTR